LLFLKLLLQLLLFFAECLLAVCASTAAFSSRQYRSRVLWDQDFRMSMQLTDVVIDAVGKELFRHEIL
tara:strand:+ start:764 stop:967 length:204 start_codon:yes stop_codon:yes gene_type:complete